MIKTTDPSFRHVCVALLILASLFSPSTGTLAQSQPSGNGAKTGPSGLQVPRFVSLKADRVNVRKGPSKEHGVDWVFRRAGLPVEVIAEFELWRRVRDSEGSDGWVYHSLLSGRRTVLVLPWAGHGKDSPSGNSQVPIYERRSSTSSIAVNVQSGVLADVIKCNGQWCRITLDRFSGWIEQDKLWGVYKGEQIN